MFLDKGYEQATIEAIAASMNMTKRTVYARYPEKSALFKAAVQHAIERLIVADAELRALETDDLEATLIAVARMRVAQVTTPEGLKLQRIINTESYRFPEIFTASYEQGAKPIVEFLAEVLRRHRATGAISVSRTRLAANTFMSMVVGGPVRMIVSGMAPDPAEVEDRITFAVQLFLNGVRAR
jgi:AcrR family transcriptional regulator